MLNSLDDIPPYIESEVRDRISAGADGSTLIVDEATNEFLVAYSDFTRALREQYKEACENRGEDNIKVYQLNINPSDVQLTRYETANGSTSEKIWRESVN
ncbi:hypothetical protein U3A55_04975 [Salarchaeum sp. III]|uniref:hypothetical protein n=1 Tax=Salarchaeum sp. III TaxID=3107927 RepID=UPI002ED78837